MGTIEAMGWSAGWLPGWLAAVGVTGLVPRARLSWTEDAAPHAVLEVPGEDPGETIAAAIPSEEAITHLAIARQHADGDVDLNRSVTPSAWRDRAVLARRSGDGSLESTVTDLATKPGEALGHGPLDPPAPKGITIYERLLAMRQTLLSVDALPVSLRASMAGTAVRVSGNGLGFDPRRLPASIHADTGPRVDPIVEVLAFAGLRMFPVRGSQLRVRQRGWTRGGLERGSFTWPAWSTPLGWWAIDALLDQVYGPDRNRPAQLRRLSVHAMYASVSQQPRGTTDVMRAIASERVL